MNNEIKPKPTPNNSAPKPSPVKKPASEYKNDSTSEINRPSKPKPPEN